MHFFTAGFSETGDEDAAALEARVLARAKALGIRVIGPNCMGLYCPAGGLIVHAVPADASPGRWRCSRSPARTPASSAAPARCAACATARSSATATAPTSASRSCSSTCAEDPETEVIACYIEGINDGAHFMRALRKAAAAKPVVILKGGRTEAGTRATRTRTRAASPVRCRSSMRRCGRRARCASTAWTSWSTRRWRSATCKSLRGPRAGIVGGGGGYSVLASDEIGAAGLEMPTLPAEIQQKLHDFTPTAGTSVRNPVDTSVGWGPDGPEADARHDPHRRRSRRTSTTSSTTPATRGARCAPEGPSIVEVGAREAAEKLGEVAKETGKPIVCVARIPTTEMGMAGTLAFQQQVAAAGLPVFNSVQAAALAVQRLLAWQAAR